MTADAPPYDAFLLLSFGGPDGPDDVLPFLRNVTRGRGIPDERLATVAEHYQHFGGVSPINDLNRTLLAGIEAELRRRGIDLPVYWGNRNWYPLVEDTMATMAAHGVRRALVWATSAYGGYSACGQYWEDLTRARESVGADAPDVEKLPHLHAFEAFVAANADAVLAAAGTVEEGARLVFTAHSVPDSADAQAGPEGHLYSTQLRVTAAAVAERVGATEWDLVWQSRSGPPQVPWLAPDICDHLDTVAADGVTDVIVAPIGFVSDHLEVVWDLDTEAAEKAEKLGLGYARAATAGTDPRFVAMVADLVEQRLGRDVVVPSVLPAPLQGVNGTGVNKVRCAVGCCGG